MEKLTEETRRELLRIANRYGLTNVRVFGSVARGDDKADSDLDILACFPPDFTLLNHARLQSEMTRLLGQSVDLVSENALRPRMRSEILHETIPL